MGGERHFEDEMDKDEVGRERTRIFRDGLLPPLTLTVEQAESYSGLSRKYLDELTRMGKLERRRVGPRDSCLVRREQLDAAVKATFHIAPSAIEEDFTFA